MRRLSPFLSCLLLAVWFGANQHCSLEAMTLGPGDGDGDRCACCQGAVGDDDCGQLESGAFKPANSTPKISPPEFLACACYLCPTPAPTAPREIAFSSGDSYVRPQEWVTDWLFVRHAAPLPGAPSAMVA